MQRLATIALILKAYELAIATMMAECASTATSTVYTMDSVVRGHHVCKEIWTSFIGEELSCKGEAGNIHDMYAVAVIKELRG